MGAID